MSAARSGILCALILSACGPLPEDEVALEDVAEEDSALTASTLLASSEALGPGLPCGQLWAFKNEQVVVPYAELFTTSLELSAQQRVFLRGRLATRAGGTHANVGIGLRLTAAAPGGPKTALIYGGENHRGLCPVISGDRECESATGSGSANPALVNFRSWVFVAPAAGRYTFTLDARAMSSPASLEYGQTQCPAAASRPLCNGEACFVRVDTAGASHLRVYAAGAEARTEVDATGELALDVPGAKTRILQRTWQAPAGMDRVEIGVDTKTDTLASTGGQSVVAHRIVVAESGSSTVLAATAWLTDTITRDKHHSTQSPVASVGGLSAGQTVRVFTEVKLVSGAPIRLMMGGPTVSTSSAMTLRPAKSP